MTESSNAAEAWTALVREMPCAMVGVDGRDGVILWNPAAERLLGSTAAEALGRPLSDFITSTVPLGAGPCLLRHRDGSEVSAIVRPFPDCPGDGRAFFLEPAPALRSAAKLVIQELLTSLPAYFSIIDRDLRYRLVCHSCELLFGRAHAEIEGKPVREMFGEDAFAQAQPLLEQALAGQPAQGELRALGADGKRHFLRIHLQPLGAGAAEGIFAFAYDLTELRQTEATLRDSEARMKFLFENNPDVIVVIGRDYRLRYINHNAGDPTTKIDDLIGYDVTQMSLPKDREALRERYRLTLETGQPVDFEAPISWRGQLRWFASRLVALPNGDKPPEEILIVARETTRRVLAEQALRESETRFRQFAENLDDVVWIHDVNPERVTYVNAAFERIWGRPRQAIYDDYRTWSEAILADDLPRVQREWQAFFDGTVAHFDCEYRILRPDGEVRIIQDFGTAIRDEQGLVIRLTGIARDITARRQAEEEKEIFQKKLVETQKLESLGVLAGGIAHDFNNLLAGILANVNLAQLDVGTSSAVSSHLDQIETIASRAADMCKQMLAYAGKGRYVISLFDLNELIEEISSLVSISISKKVAVLFNQTMNLPAIRGDASQMRQVVLNLILNASEAFGDSVGEVGIRTGTIDMSAEELAAFHFGPDLRPGSCVFLEVSDCGPGIPPEVFDRIFEPFFTTKFTGRGLGLSAVRGIVRGHGGAIRVVSTVGKGTTFTLLFPPAEHALAEIAAPPTEIATFQTGGEVLIIDDEDVIRSTLAMMFESFGFAVRTASNGREGVEIFEHRHPHLRLVLLDLTMPVLSGDEAHAELVRINPSVPVIFMSGYMEQELADHAHGHPIAGFLQKPFRMEDLEQLIGEVLNDGPANR